ncbi:MAG: hypothetical protein HN534_04925 [Euryarchaeota archaeon]|jgi:predicted CoA-binding protein|nr:hypothetical protein [Euryarchaeota archaeon]MBT3654253.1 hypothetical protein [Euryarchaeota archaeon]MBT3758061.1 hypothetical protein [Euryarchaeota archaeon]MBT4050314.1 hypothetical protein [Euryarchaeota archaeon]MBT4346610.1 hypothetical protein [Euryarchaeota archaeon]
MSNNVDIDLHTLRNAVNDEAIDWALGQRNWAFIGLNSSDKNDKMIIEKFISRGQNVSLIDNLKNSEGSKIFGFAAHASLSGIDDDIEIVSVHGDVDLWTLVEDITQRMQWFGDLKAIWIPATSKDDRWVSEMYDYGFAVISGKDISQFI